MAAPWLLVISKHPEYGPAGEVMPGQCEPYTFGWRLCLFRDGEEDVLLNGTYYELRKVQGDCTGKDVEQIRAIAAQARERMQAAANQAPLIIGPGGPSAGETIEDLDFARHDKPESQVETDELDAEELGVGASRKSDEDTDEFEQPPLVGDAAQAFETTVENGVCVATVMNPQILSGDGAETALFQLMQASQGALVIDIGRLPELPPEVANALGRFTYQREQEGRFVALAGVREEILAALQTMQKKGTLQGYVVGFMDQASAVAEARSFLNNRRS